MVLKRLLPSKRARANGPSDVRLYAVGDIHGRIDLLDALMARIDAERGDLPKRFVFLGDYVDRGPASSEVIARLLEFEDEGREATFLKGNHEAAMLDFLRAPSDNDAWMHWGGDATLRSYGVDVSSRRAVDEIGAEFRDKLPAAHREFLERLALAHEAGDYFFAHAGVRPGVSLEDQDEEDLLWIREEFHAAPPDQRPEKTVVHGHHPYRRPVDNGWRVGVDTGAVWSGVLTAVVIEGDSRRFISAVGEPAD